METAKSIESIYSQAFTKLDTELENRKLKLQNEQEKALLVFEKQELIAKKNLKMVMIEDLKFENENPDRAYLRQLRRENEIKTGKLIPPGPWDFDLDTYQDEECVIHLSSENEGYQARIQRNKETHSWDIFIKVPENHWTFTNYYIPGMLYDRIQKDDFKYKMFSFNLNELEIGFDNGSTETSYIDMYESTQIAYKIVERLKKGDNLSLGDNSL